MLWRPGVLGEYLDPSESDPVQSLANERNVASLSARWPVASS
jgi:hypothetical protein